MMRSQFDDRIIVGCAILTATMCGSCMNKSDDHQNVDLAAIVWAKVTDFSLVVALTWAAAWTAKRGISSGQGTV